MQYFRYMDESRQAANLVVSAGKRLEQRGEHQLIGQGEKSSHGGDWRRRRCEETALGFGESYIPSGGT